MSNTLRIWPISPCPADITREPIWNEGVVRYDSGARQGSTPYVRPMWKFSISMSNLPRSKQSSLQAFYNLHRGMVAPWLFKDPYDNRVDGRVCVNTGTSPTSFRVFNAESFSVIPESGSIVITSAKSGQLTQGSHYVLDQDTGIVVASLRPSSADFWTASCSFFKKCAFSAQAGDASQLWENFNAQVQFEELI